MPRGVPEPARGTLDKARGAIRSAVPEEAAEVIGCRIPAFRRQGPPVGFGAFADHRSLFVMSPPVMEAFAGKLKGFSTSKGTIRFRWISLSPRRSSENG